MTMGPKRTNLFLIELVFNLFIFALCAAVCVGLLLHARRLSQESERLSQAVTLAQSAAESLRTGGTLPEVPEGYEISPLLTAEEGLVDAQILVLYGGETVYTLDCAWPDDGSTDWSALIFDTEEVAAP